MRIETLQNQYQGEWMVESVEHAHEHLHDAEKLVEVCQPHLVVNLREYLGEATYRELVGLIDPNFLSQSVRAAELKRSEFVGFEHNIMQFMVPSSEFENNHIKYANLVQFDAWDEVGQMTDLNYREKALMLLWESPMRLHCSCPSFLYHSYEYLLTVLDAAIYPEDRRGVIRNPNDAGIMCKHLNFTMRVVPFSTGRIASELKNQFGE